MVVRRVDSLGLIEGFGHGRWWWGFALLLGLLHHDSLFLLSLFNSWKISLPSFVFILGVWLNRMSPKHLIAYLLFGIGIPMQIPSRGRTLEKVQCYEPATMKYLGFCPALRPDEVSDAMCVITGTGWYPLLSHFTLAVSWWILNGRGLYSVLCGTTRLNLHLGDPWLVTCYFLFHFPCFHHFF